MDAPHSSPLPAVPPLPASILLPSLLLAPLLTPVGLPAVSTTGTFGTVQGTKPTKSSSSPHKRPQKHQCTGTPPSVDFLLFVSLVDLLFIYFAYTAPDEEKKDSDVKGCMDAQDICGHPGDNGQESYMVQGTDLGLHPQKPPCCHQRLQHSV